MRIIPIIVMFLYLANRGVYFSLTPVQTPEDTPVKTYMLLISYLTSAIYLVGRVSSVAKLLMKLWPYLAMTIMAFATAFNGNSSIALWRVGHDIGLFLVAACIFFGYRGNIQMFFRDLNLFMLICLICSVLLVVLLPDRGMQHPSWHNYRWLGVTSHPNILGAVALSAIWAKLSQLLLTRPNSGQILGAMVVIGLALMCLIGADSRSCEISAFLVFAIFAIFWGRRFDWAKAAPRTLVLAGVGVLGWAALTLLGTKTGFFAARDGASDALSGRPIIWGLGIQMVQAHPFGISYDNLDWFWQVNGLRKDIDQFTHFHDGFLDVAAKGGIVSLGFLIMLLGKNYFDLSRIFRANYTMFVSGIAILSACIIYNFQDTSFMREEILWSLQIISWPFYLVFPKNSHNFISDACKSENYHA